MNMIHVSYFMPERKSPIISQSPLPFSLKYDLFLYTLHREIYTFIPRIITKSDCPTHRRQQNKISNFIFFFFVMSHLMNAKPILFKVYQLVRRNLFELKIINNFFLLRYVCDMGIALGIYLYK